MRDGGLPVSVPAVQGPVATVRLRWASVSALVAVTAFCAGRADAQDSNWIVSAGNWSDSNCWGNGEPTSATNASIDNAGTATVSQVGAACNSLGLGTGAGQSGSVNMVSGTLESAYDQCVGGSGTGLFTHSDGNNTVGSLSGWGSLHLGADAGSSGTYQLSGNGLLTATWEYVGYRGTGLFLQSGGENAVASSLYLGVEANSSGTYELSGDGRLTASNVEIGDYGTGLFTHSGGDSAVSNQLNLGVYAGSSGTYHLSGDGRLTAAWEVVGFSGTGLFTHSDGNHVVSSLHLGAEANSSGTYELSGNGRLTAQQEFVGGFWPSWEGPRGGTGVFRQSGGENTVTNVLCLGLVANSSGTYELSGNGRLTAQEEFIGGCYWYGASGGGTGVFKQSGGENTVTYSLCLGGDANSSGTYELSGDGRLIAQEEYVGGYPWGGPAGGQTGIFTHSDGNNTIANSLLLGGSAGSSGTYHLSGNGILATGQEEYVGYSGTGLFVQTGGENTVSWSLYVGFDANSSGTYDLSGNGRLSAGQEYVGYSGMGLFVQTGGENTVSWELCVGYEANSSGTYELSGTGCLTAQQEFVGGVPWYSGPGGAVGTFRQSDGNNTVLGELIVGGGPGSQGTYELSGGRLTVVDDWVCVGIEGGTGIFKHTGGDHVTEDLCLGDEPNSSGLYELSGTGRLIARWVGVGEDGGTGVFRQIGGENTISGNLNVGSEANGFGTYELSGTGCLAVGLGLIGMDGGTGVFKHSDGNHTVTTFLVLGLLSGTGTYELSGQGRLTAVEENVGWYDGNGTFRQSGGDNMVSGALHVGHGPHSAGAYDLSGTGRLTAGEESIGWYGGMGTFRQTDGNNVVLGALRVGHGAGASGTYELGGGLLTASAEYIGEDGNATFLHTGGRNSTASISIGAKGWYGLTGGVCDVGLGIDNSGILDLSAGTGVLATGGPVKITGTGQFLLGGGALGHTDPNLHVEIRNDGNVRITGGSHVVGFVLPVSGGVLGGVTRVEAGAALGLSAIRQREAAVNGTLTITGDPATASALDLLTIGGESNAAGAFDLQGGDLFAGDLYVGGTSSAKGGTGTCTISGGDAAVDGRLVVWDGSAVHLGAGTLVDTDPNHPYLDVESSGTLYVEEGVYCLGRVQGIGDTLAGTIVVAGGATLWVESIKQGSLIVEAGGTLRFAAEDYDLFLSLAKENQGLVPEPGSLVLIGLGGLALARRRGHRPKRQSARASAKEAAAGGGLTRSGSRFRPFQRCQK